MPHTNSKKRVKTSKPAKRRKPQIDSNSKTRSLRPRAVVFDENDRYNYLTGFSTRKKAAKLAAQERAIERAKEEKRELRRQLKQTRLSKIKESIEQQAEWYGTDAFSELEDLRPGSDRPESNIKTFIEESQDRNFDGQVHTRTTTVTIEPLEVDHTVLMNPSQISAHFPYPSKPQDSHTHQDPNGSRRGQSYNQSSVSNRKTHSAKESREKKNKKKKVPYESKATRTIERVKKQSKRKSKSIKKQSSKKR